MYEITIDEILETDLETKKFYIGSFAYDEKPKIDTYPSCFILNTEPRTKSGQHWLAFYFDENKNSYFFDSYGNDPSFYKVEDYLKTNSIKIFYNKKKIQGLLPYCGFYCIFFLLFIVRGKLNDFYKPFSEILILNDNFMHENIER
jgi:hypothetical protein